MIEFIGRKHSTFSKSKEATDVSVVGLKDYFGMTNRILSVLVDERIQRGVIIVVDFFPFFHVMI